MQSICVFCGSKEGARPEYGQAARELGRAIAERGLSLVFGGGSVGLMGALADSALDAGGYVVGVIPLHLCSREILHTGLSRVHTTADLLERKRVMMDVADAFIALPGGLGTYDEILEVLTWNQLGRHHKRCGLLNINNYFAPFLATLEHAVAERFLSRETAERLTIAHKPNSLVDSLIAPKSP